MALYSKPKRKFWFILRRIKENKRNEIWIGPLLDGHIFDRFRFCPGGGSSAKDDQASWWKLETKTLAKRQFNLEDKWRNSEAEQNTACGYLRISVRVDACYSCSGSGRKG